MKKALYIITLLLLVSFAVNVVQYERKMIRHEVEVVTITDTDTLHFSYIDFVYDTIFRYDTLRLPAVMKPHSSLSPDTMPSKAECDSVDVVIPISQRTYKDSLYTAWVSGYEPRLDSIEVYPVTNYIYKTITRKEYDKRKKWSLGVGIGYGYNGREFSPYVGIGIQRTIFGW